MYQFKPSDKFVYRIHGGIHYKILGCSKKETDLSDLKKNWENYEVETTKKIRFSRKNEN